MKIYILCNDVSHDEEMRAEHGFSCLIAYNGARLLFDMGDTALFMENANNLGLDAGMVDYAAISHAHYDHGGGLLHLAHEHREFELLLHREFFTPKYWDKGDTYRYAGNNFRVEELRRLRINFSLINTDLYALEKMRGGYLLSSFVRNCPFERVAAPARAHIGGEFVQDVFAEEMAFAADTKEGLVIVTGCSHNGVVNMIEHARARLNRPVHAVIGGTHLVDADEKQLEGTIAYLNNHPEIKRFIPLHCTGEAAQKRLEKECGAYESAGAGSVLAFED
ncbi:MBL fold metallo-hydrolase [Christensenellaceae bacterium OttesenSCG-928-M15]|nr:MBL fold metallo-hydrolase [Christensenellaceae bacterium OttesenSCG-928-M15]